MPKRPDEVDYTMMQIKDWVTWWRKKSCLEEYKWSTWKTVSPHTGIVSIEERQIDRVLSGAATFPVLIPDVRKYGLEFTIVLNLQVGRQYTRTLHGEPFYKPR